MYLFSPSPRHRGRAFLIFLSPTQILERPSKTNGSSDGRSTFNTLPRTLDPSSTTPCTSCITSTPLANEFTPSRSVAPELPPASPSGPAAEVRAHRQAHRLGSPRFLPPSQPSLPAIFFCAGCPPATAIDASNHATRAARFSPDDKFSSQRITCKKRFNLLLTQRPPDKL